MVVGTASSFRKLAGEPVLDEAEVRGEVVDAGAPRVRGCAVAAPALPLFAVELIGRESADWLAVGPHERRIDVDHVDLRVRVSGIDADVDIRLAAIVSGRYRKIVQDDAQDIAFCHQLIATGDAVEPVEILLREDKVPATLKTLRLIQREGYEPFHAGPAEVDLPIELDAAGLSAPHLEVDGVLLRRLLARQFKQFAPGQSRVMGRVSPLVDMNRVLVPSAGRSRVFPIFVRVEPVGWLVAHVH